MKCPGCQNENYDGARFCLTCGAPLPRPASRAKKFFLSLLKALCYYLVFFGLQSAVIFFYEFFLAFREMFTGILNGTVEPGNLMPEDLIAPMMDALAQNVHILLILSAAATLLVLFIFFQARRKNPLSEMGLRSAPISKMFFALLLGLGLQFFVSITMAFLPIPKDVIESFNEGSEMLYGGGPFWIELLSIAVVTPILEEVIFRGLIFTRLRGGMPTAIALIVGSLIFGAAHGHIISLIYAGCLGVLLSLIMLRCGGSILPAIFCHAGFNGGSYLLQLALGDTESVPLMLVFYTVAMALAIMSGYLLFRPAATAEEE